MSHLKRSFVSFAFITICVFTAAFISSCGKSPQTASSDFVGSEAAFGKEESQTASLDSNGSEAVSEEKNRNSSNSSANEKKQNVPVLIKGKQKSAKTVSQGAARSRKVRENYAQLQKSVDQGHNPGLLNPEEVSMNFAATTLKITDLGKIYDTMNKSVKGDHATVVFKKSGKSVLTIELYQPVKKGANGIWAVTSWTDGKTNKKHSVL